MEWIKLPGKVSRERITVEKPRTDNFVNPCSIRAQKGAAMELSKVEESPQREIVVLEAQRLRVRT